MTEKHLEKIDAEARKIYNYAADSISSFFQSEYGNSPEDTLQNQIGDFHLIAERACVYMMGNVLAMLDLPAEEEAILTLTRHLRSMARTIRQMTPDPNGKLN